MSDIPKYDPTKIVKRAYVKDINSSNLSEPSTDGEVPKYDASKIVKRGYVAKEDFQEEGFTPDKYISDTGGDNIESTLDFIQKNSKRLMRDDEKDILRDMFKNPNATKEDISDAIVTLQGKKAKQQENTLTTPDYYMDRDEKGVYKPIALGLGEKTPKGKETVSIWGTQKKANDDNLFSDIAKTAFNIIPGVVGGVIDVAQLGTELVAGEESEWLKQAQNATEYLKFKKDEDIEKSIYNTEDINKFTDLFDSSRVNLSPETIWGTALSAAGFMGEMLVPSSLIAKGAKGYKAGKAGLALIEEAGGISKIAQKASVFAGSFMTQIGDVMDSSSEAGLEGRVKALYDLTIGTLLASVDAKYDVAGKILTNKLAQDAKKEILSEVGKKVVKDKLGNVTKESLNEAAKEAMTAYTPIVSGFAKNFGKDVLDEVKDEVLQSFIEKAGQNVYDKLSPQDKANFGTDAFSAKSFGEYINSAVSGLVGAGAPSLMSAKGKQQVDYKAQSNSAYDTVMQGEEAVKAFKTNITNAFQSGQINKEDYDNAILKVDAYDSYEKTTKDLTLDNENKKKLFELSLQKENLKAAIKFATEKDKEGKSRLDQMKPIELGLHNSKVEQADKIQKEIDLIVTKSEVLQQPEVAEKVVEKVVKAEEKATEGAKAKEGVSSEIGAILGRQYKVKTPVGGEVAVPGKAAYEVPKKVLEEKRKMKDFSTQEWNIANASVKQAKLADALEEVPEKTVEGTLRQDNKYQDKKTGLWVQTYNLTLPNGKTAQFASSMVRFPEEGSIGGFRGNTYEENLTNKKSPIGQKLGATVRTLKDSGRKVIFIWNADEGPKYGKHIGMVREDAEGKSVYGAADLDEMADLRMINMGQNPNAPAPGIFTPKEPTKGGAPKVSIPFTITTDMRRQLADLGYKKVDVQNMKPEEANNIINTQKTKPKPKTELKEVEIKEKKAAAKANEAKRKAEINAIIAEDKKKTGGAYITRTAAAKIDEVNARYAALEKPTTTPTDLEAAPAKEKSEAVAEKTPKILVKKEEMDKMLEGKTVPVEEGMSPKEYIRDVLSESENAGQIAEAYLMADEKIEAGDFNSKYDVIYLFFASGKRLSRESLGKQYDDKFINRKDLPGLYSYTVKEGGYPISTDSITQFDDTITPQDVANFIADFPNGYTEYEKIIEDSTRTKLATKFKKIARRALTPNLAKEVFKNYIEKEKQKEEKDYFSDSMLEEELTKEEYRKQAEEGYLQKAKVKPATLNKFEKSVDLFYKTKDADGASKKRSLAAERREFLEKNPSVKYIDDNMKYIYKQLEDQNIIERKGECP